MYGWDRYGGTYSTRGWSPGEASGLQLVLALAGTMLLMTLIVMSGDYPDMPAEGVLFLGLIVVLFFLACVADAHPVVGGILLVSAAFAATVTSLVALTALWLQWQSLQHDVVVAAVFLAYSLMALIPSLISLRQARRELMRRRAHIARRARAHACKPAAEDNDRHSR